MPKLIYAEFAITKTRISIHFCKFYLNLKIKCLKSRTTKNEKTTVTLIVVFIFSIIFLFQVFRF